MKKDKLRAVLAEAIRNRSFCRCQFHYGNLYRNYIPLLAGEKIFLCAREHDFTLDGFSVRRVRDLKKIRIKTDQYARILHSEGGVEELTAPDIDLTSWQSVFIGLEKKKTPVWIKSESMRESADISWMGIIQEVCKHDLYLRTFDDEGNWAREDTLIPYDAVTSVTFDSRYMRLFAKYAAPFPTEEKAT